MPALALMFAHHLDYTEWLRSAETHRDGGT